MPWSSGIYTKWNASNVPPNWVGDASVGIKIEAARHDTQDDDFATGINNCLTKDGQNSPTANLPMNGKKHTNVADASAANEYATYGQLQTLLPPGAITAYVAAAAPAGWLLCNGSPVSRTTYASLYAIIGTTYGVGDGSTTFNVPDLRQKFPLGKAASGTGATLGASGGAIDHTHTNYAHYHSMTGAGTTLATGTTGSGHGHAHTLATASAGDHAHTYNRPTASANTGSGGTSVWDNTVTSSNTNTTGAHTHTITGSVGGSDGTHTHNLTGSIGNVTGAKSGDSDQATSANNPPYLVVNYIIKT